MILSLEIEQHADYLKNIFYNTGSLTKMEMELIKNLSEFIKNYPERQYTMKSLRNRSGLSSAKLQEDFPIMQGPTVIYYIRDIRIFAARQ
jgi:AraC-like DNA-binding protein